MNATRFFACLQLGVVTLLLGCAAELQPPKPVIACPDVRAIYEEMQTQFTNLRDGVSERRASGEYWGAKQVLRGFDVCEIRVFDRGAAIAYECRKEFEAGQFERAEALFDSGSQATRSCLRSAVLVSSTGSAVTSMSQTYQLNDEANPWRLQFRWGLLLYSRGGMSVSFEAVANRQSPR